MTGAWHPMADPVDIKHLGKLAEELGELSAAVARCLIQGINEAEPTTGKINRAWLEEEIADVIANIGLVVERFKLDTDAMSARVQRKTELLAGWHGEA
jgi:NTP pyrophosphatase (non-canonical NTP hydrolase)